jgi:hypothetical protein
VKLKGCFSKQAMPHIHRQAPIKFQVEKIIPRDKKKISRVAGSFLKSYLSQLARKVHTALFKNRQG